MVAACTTTSVPRLSVIRRSAALALAARSSRAASSRTWTFPFASGLRRDRLTDIGRRLLSDRPQHQGRLVVSISRGGAGLKTRPYNSSLPVENAGGSSDPPDSPALMAQALWNAARVRPIIRGHMVRRE